MSARMHSPSDLSRVVEEILPGLYNTAYYLARDATRAEDLVQETIAMFLESARRNPPGFVSRAPGASASSRASTRRAP